MSRENLVDSLAMNRLTLAATRERLEALRLEVGGQLLESVRLGAAARQALAELAQTRQRVAARVVPPGSLGRRFTAHTTRPADGADTDRRRLHELYAATRDATVMADLMASYDGFARSLATRFRRREQDDDLLQVARIGLLQAVQRFEPALGRPFLVFARATIVGELKRHLRDRTWSMRIPRSLKEDYLVVIQAVDELTMADGKSPSMQTLATRCGLSVERVVEALELRSNQWALSLDGLSGGDDNEVVDITPGQDDAASGCSKTVSSSTGCSPASPIRTAASSSCGSCTTRRSRRSPKRSA